jgi:hypothetical protein
MARTIAQIQATIIADIQADSTLAAKLTSTSRTAIWRLWAYIVAVQVWLLENTIDQHTAEVEAMIAAKVPHTLRWYATKAKAFQYGSTLVGEGYDNSGLTDEQITALQVVKQAAAVESNGRLVIKIATNTNGNLTKLPTPQYNAFVEYIAQVKDAGVALDVINFEGDRLRLSVSVFYDPLVLDANGARLDGTDATPVRTAILNFLKVVPFNALFVRTALVDAVQQVSGVKTFEINSCEARKFDVSAWTAVGAYYQPYSGWLNIYTPLTDLIIVYHPFPV